MKQALIAGCGYVGAELARRLVAGGNVEVFGLRRRPESLPAGVRSIACDLGDPRATALALAVLPAALDAVVYAVGADAHTEVAYESAYLRSLGNLMDTLDARGSAPNRLIVVSSTAVYGQNDGEWVDEGSLTEPTEFAGRILLRSEALACSRGASSVVVRFGGIYGPGRHRFVESVRSGAIRLANGIEFTNRVHRDDCAEILRHLLMLPRPEAVYIGVDNEPADRRVVAEWMAKRLGSDLPSPAAIVDARPHGKRCSNRRLRESGYQFLYPSFREGYGLAMPRPAD